ncbi:MAG: iron-sulfur cluster assembly accessory protein [Candidatus Omnitrophica bacterium]|nr:iron-sulfur cluster assembly accessory protein [Candidatus Omnitrophota bacterium]
MIELTEKAARKFFEIRQSMDRPKAALRAAVLGGDCAGLKYHIGLDDFRLSGDICFRSRGVDIYVDYISSHYIMNSEIDWHETDGESGFILFNANPREGRSGCSYSGEGQGCITLGDGSHCSKEKSAKCGCHADPTEIIYKIDCKSD